MLLNCGVGEDFWESLGLQGDQASQSEGKSALNIHWKDCCWSWRSNPLATWCKELTHWKRPWFWARLKARGEGDYGREDGWIASPTWWTWVWASPESWWRTGKPCKLQSVESQLSNWTQLDWIIKEIKFSVKKQRCAHHILKNSSYQPFTKDPIKHIHIDTESLYIKG